MAKQTSLIKIKGKADGQSFYTSKNGGALMRSINKGMGQRVKESQEYLNTRKNNAEFGACGDFAGAFIGTISQRWRFILDSIATGKMVKAAKSLIVLDPTGTWGHREIQATDFGVLIDSFNGLSKNEMPGAIANGAKSHIVYKTADAATAVVGAAAVDTDLMAQLDSIGADGFLVDVYRYVVEMPVTADSGNEYTKAKATLVPLDAISVNVTSPGVGEDIFSDGDSVLTAGYPNDDSAELAAIFVLYRPYRTVGAEINVLQQHCAGMLYEPNTVA